MIQRIIDFIRKLFGIQLLTDESEDKIQIYEKKPFMTDYEMVFYSNLRELEPEYKVIPQVNLATIVRKINKGYINELFKNIDFAVFDSECKNLLLLIELNDSTHNKSNRKDRDLRVKRICNDANIKLITFYTKYPNEKEYVLNRIKNEIKCLNNASNEIGENHDS